MVNRRGYVKTLILEISTYFILLFKLADIYIFLRSIIISYIQLSHAEIHIHAKFLQMQCLTLMGENVSM